MRNISINIFRSSGVSLIEALISLAVLSFGALAIAKFQASLVSESAYSKTRNEAVKLAHQKMDQLRSYSTEPELVAQLMAMTFDPANTTMTAYQFPDDVAAGTYPATAETIAGTAADYTRQWDTSCTTDTCQVMVAVRWTDPRDGLQMVSLESDIVFNDPRGPADLDVNDYEPAVPSATGRAYLGDGTVTQAQLDAGTDNQDGTVSIANIGDDRVLVDETNQNLDGTYNIVLTLEDACLTEDGTCIDFVKIRGRIYRDADSNPSATLSDIYVVASDAAYCARNFAPGSAASPNETTHGDYQYFDYTCYLGGGWHGNVGLLINNQGSQDTVCLGDPSSPNTDDGDATNNWRQMELATRRVYRGMTFIGDASTGVLPADTIYYSQGIGDAVELPDPGDRNPDGTLIPDTDFRYYGHDYVLTRITGNPTGEDCYASLTRGDSDADNDGTPGDLFYGVSSDFICLNEERVPETFKYLDSFRTGHWAKNFCPYDPSRGPALAYYITGRVSVPAGDVLDGSEILNSVSADNCTFVTSLADMNNLTPMDVTGHEYADYVCLVYDWGNGWTGQVYVTEGFGITCPGPLTFTDISGSSGDVFPNNDFVCETLAQPTIIGTITAPWNDLTGSTVTSIRTNTDGTEVSLPCDVTVTEVGSATYGCTVAEETLGGGWVGRVELTPPADFTCTATTHPYTTPVHEPGLTLQDFSCDGPLQQIILSGTAMNDTAPAGDMFTGMTIVDSAGNNCTKTLLANNDVDYSCSIIYDTRVSGSWTGSVTITPPTGFWCGTTTAASTTSGSWSSDSTLPDVSCERSASVYVNVLIDDSVTPADTYSNYYISGTLVELRDATGAVVATHGNGCNWLWANGGVDTELRCITPVMRKSDLWSGSFYVPATTGYKLCPANTITLTDLTPSNTYNYTLISVAEATVCP